ncbi:MAG: PspC domain-containing protein, partial [Chloroflexota bacterium]|nr:PspC domain-containing protein [Chloroflexota bacterium]
GGLGEYLNTDPTVIRIIFVLLAIIGVGFGGLILYLAMWLIVPEEPVEVVAVVPTPAPVVEEPAVEEPAQEEPTEE